MLEHLFRNCANNSADEHCVDHQDVDPVSVFTWQGLGGRLAQALLNKGPRLPWILLHYHPPGKASSKPKSRRSLENPNGSPARRVTTFACAYDGVVGAIHDPLQRGTAINACGATCSCCHQGTFMNSYSCARKQNSLHLHPVGALNAGC